MFIFKKIIQRDLKSSNIDFKICDFGISKIVDSDSNKLSVTKGIESSFFMAPEIINEEQYNEKADVYSFGVLLFFMLIGGQMLKIQISEICSEFNKFSKDIINANWNLDLNQRPSLMEFVQY